MGQYFKYLGTKESARKLWENRETLDKYLARLKEFWDEENKCWLEQPKPLTKTNEHRHTS